MIPNNILKATIKNFMGISNIDISPEGNILQVVGENANGKTTVVEAIKTFFKGSTNGLLVKHGEDQAEIFVEIPGYTGRRIIKPNDTQSLVLRDRNDAPQSGPQTILNGLIDDSGFNPLECLDPKKRHEAILNAIPLKLTAESLANRLGVGISELPKPGFRYEKHALEVIDEAYTYYDRRRTELNREALTAENKWKAYEQDFKPIVPPNTTKLEIKAKREVIQLESNDINFHLRNIENDEISNAGIRVKIENYNKDLSTYKAQKELRVFEAERELLELEQKIVNLKIYIENTQDKFNQKMEDGARYIEDTQKELKTVVDKSEFLLKLSELKEQSSRLDVADGELDLYARNQSQAKMISGLEDEYKEAAEYAKTAENQAKSLQNSFKIELMKTVDMPIDGLEYIDGKFLVNGSSIDLLSSAEALVIGIKISRALAGPLKLILVNGFERIYGEMRDSLLKTIKDDGFIYIFEGGKDPHPNYPSIKMNKGMVEQ